MNFSKESNYGLLPLIAISLFTIAVAERSFWYMHSEVWLFGLGARMAIAESQAYLDMSKNLFSYDLNHVRMPLVPLLIAAIRQIFGPEIWKFVLFNHLVSIISVFLLYKLVSECLPKAWALIASSIYSIDPVSVYFTNGIVPETEFTCLVILSVYFLFLAIKKRSTLRLIVSCIGFGLCILTRPTGWYFVFLIPCLTAIYFSGSWLYRFKMASISFAVIFGLALPWLMVHQSLYGSFSLSTSQSFNLLNIEAANARAYALQLDVPDVQKELVERGNFLEYDNPFKRATLQKELAIKTLLEHRWSYLILKIKSTAKLLFMTGNRRTCTKYCMCSMDPTMEFLQFNKLPFAERIKAKIVYRISNMTGCEWVAGGFVGAYNLLLYFGLALCFLKVITKHQAKTFLVLFWLSLAMIVYFTVFVHTAPLTRFRLPMTPFLVALSTFGFLKLFEEIRGIRGQNEH